MKYFSMFSGIGGFEYGIQKNRQWKCIGYSEINKYAIQIYNNHFGGKNYGDATKIRWEEVPNFDLLVGGFPCQAFSIAGKRRGFKDTRGTLFFEIAKGIKEKQPRMLLLENVKGLLNHNGGETFTKILQTLDELGYDAEWEVLNSKHFGVPQNRERVFIIGHLRGTSTEQIFPLGRNSKQTDEDRESKIVGTIISQYAKNPTDGNYLKVGTLRTHKDGQGFREVKAGVSPTIPARAREDGSGQPVIAVLTPDRPDKRQNGRRFKEDGEEMFTLTGQDKHGVMKENKIRRLTPTECERLQGFPDGWTEGVSDTQRYKTLGNAVTTNVIKAIIEKIINVKENEITR